MAKKFTTRKSWSEKMQVAQQSKIVKLPPEAWEKMGGATMLVSTPHDVDAMIRTVPKGKLMTSRQLRARLAREAGAECACPTSTGIFVRIAAEAAEEERAAGKERITPYWRVLKPDGGLNEKLPGGVEAQSSHLKAEGHVIEPARGKQPPKVKDFDKKLVKD
jgi:alkylated DNA nucleotide flippase Atl1